MTNYITFFDFMSSFQEYDNLLGDYSRAWINNPSMISKTIKSIPELRDQLLKNGYDNYTINDWIQLLNGYRSFNYFLKKKSREYVYKQNEKE